MVLIKLISGETFVGESVEDTKEKSGIILSNNRCKLNLSRHSNRCELKIDVVKGEIDFSWGPFHNRQHFDIGYAHGNETVVIPTHSISFVEIISDNVVKSDYKWFDRTKEQAEKILDEKVKEEDERVLKFNSRYKEEYINESKIIEAIRKAKSVYYNFTIRDIFFSEGRWIKKNYKKFLSETQSEYVTRMLKENF